MPQNLTDQVHNVCEDAINKLTKNNIF